MHQGNRRLHALILQVGEELSELRRCEHSLVDQRACRERREVDGLVTISIKNLVLNMLASKKRSAVKNDSSLGTRSICNKELPKSGHCLQCGGANHGGIYWNIAPPENSQALGLTDLVNHLACRIGVIWLLRQKRNTNCISAVCRKLKINYCPQKSVRYLNQDARTVTRILFRSCSASVFKVAERSQTLSD